MKTRWVVMAVAGLVLALPSVSEAGQAEMDKIAAGCSTSTNWSDEACTCIAEAAGEDLTDAQQAHLAATLNDEDATAIAGQLSPPELLEASMFMIKSGPACQ